MKRSDNIIQGSDDWHQLRKGKITGTTLKAIMGTKYAREQAYYEIIAERLLSGLEDDENPMDRGIRLEPDAIASFEMETGKMVERTGFCQMEGNDKIAYSPDGLIGEEEDVEIKCMGGKNHVKLWLTNEVPDEYWWQVVQAFVVNPKLKKRYFVGYNPDITVHPIHIIEVKREQVLEDIENAEKSQKEFLEEVENKLKEIIKL